MLAQLSDSCRTHKERPSQLDLMSNTSLLITPSGGLGTVSMFLQPGATALVFNFWADTRGTSEQQENIMSWNVEYVDFEVRDSAAAWVTTICMLLLLLVLLLVVVMRPCTVPPGGSMQEVPRCSHSAATCCSALCA